MQTRKVSESRVGVRRKAAISKQDLLLFDSLVMVGFDEYVSDQSTADHVVADLAYLQEQDVVVGLPDEHEAVAELFFDVVDVVPTELRDEVRRTGSILWHPSLLRPLSVGGELYVATALSLGQRPAIAIMEQQPSPHDWDVLNDILGGLAVNRSRDVEKGVIEVVIQNLPLPSEDVPLDELLDFARSLDMKRRREGMFLAISRMAATTDNPQEASAEAAEAIHEFDQHMRLADLRYGTSSLRLTMTAVLEGAEQLLHLRPRRAIDSLFTLHSLRADRLEAELTAPGHQFAYVYEARRHFAERRRRGS